MSCKEFPNGWYRAFIIKINEDHSIEVSNPYYNYIKTHTQKENYEIGPLGIDNVTNLHFPEEDRGLYKWPNPFQKDLPFNWNKFVDEYNAKIKKITIKPPTDHIKWFSNLPLPTKLKDTYTQYITLQKREAGNKNKYQFYFDRRISNDFNLKTFTPKYPELQGGTDWDITEADGVEYPSKAIIFISPNLNFEEYSNFYTVIDMEKFYKYCEDQEYHRIQSHNGFLLPNPKHFEKLKGIHEFLVDWDYHFGILIRGNKNTKIEYDMWVYDIHYSYGRLTIEQVPRKIYYDAFNLIT